MFRTGSTVFQVFSITHVLRDFFAPTLLCFKPLHVLTSPTLFSLCASSPLLPCRCGWWKRSVAPFMTESRNPHPGILSTISWRTPSFSSTTSSTTSRWSTTPTLTMNRSGRGTTLTCIRPSESPLLLRSSIRSVPAHRPVPTASTASPPRLTATTMPSRAASTTWNSP